MQMSGDCGPAISTAAGAVGAGAASIGLVTFTDVGCSPMRPRLNSLTAVNQVFYCNLFQIPLGRMSFVTIAL